MRISWSPGNRWLLKTKEPGRMSLPAFTMPQEDTKRVSLMKLMCFTWIYKSLRTCQNAFRCILSPSLCKTLVRAWEDHDNLGLVEMLWNMKLLKRLIYKLNASLKTISAKIGQTQLAHICKHKQIGRYGIISLNFVQGALAQSPGNLGSWNSSQTSPCNAKCFQWMQPLNAQQQLYACAMGVWVRNVNQGIHGMPQRDCRRAQGMENWKCWRGRIEWTKPESQLTNTFLVSIEP